MGSPPPMRGKVVQINVRFERVQDHPRLCGEKVWNWIFTRVVMGSPPPMRGKELSEALGVEIDRITPAYAGKSHREGRASGGGYGSPPPMRGKAIPLTVAPPSKRITPAYAGKSRYARRGFRFGGDHPRLCGEKGLNTRKWTIALGSPPPMRGKVSTQHKE